MDIVCSALAHETEVVSGAGETTCGNTQCPLHTHYNTQDQVRHPLKTLELPFSYVEDGENKFALPVVEVVLCGRCPHVETDKGRNGVNEEYGINEREREHS